jgi:hypothetical protein
MALIKRFSSTCCRCTRSPWISARPSDGSASTWIPPRPRRGNEVDGLPHESAHAQRPLFQLALLEESAHAPDHLAGARVVALYVLQDLPDLVEGKRTRGGRQQGVRDPGVLEDRVQRLIDLVGERGGELSQSGSSIQVRHRRKTAPALELCAPAPSALEDEPEDEKSLRDGYRDGREHESAPIAPQVGLSKEDFAPRRKPALGNSPPQELAFVERESRIRAMGTRCRSVEGAPSRARASPATSSPTSDQSCTRPPTTPQPTS